MRSEAFESAELVLAENNRSDYQIVLPDPIGDPFVEAWLMFTARFPKKAFAKDGFQVEITNESGRMFERSGI